MTGISRRFAHGDARKKKGIRRGSMGEVCSFGQSVEHICGGKTGLSCGIKCNRYTKHLLQFTLQGSIIQTEEDFRRIYIAWNRRFMHNTWDGYSDGEDINWMLRKVVDGCGSFFCKHCHCGLDHERPPPRMIGSRTVRTGSDFHRRCSRQAQGKRDRVNRKAWSGWHAPQHQFYEASHGPFPARLGACISKLLTGVLSLLPRGLPRLVPAPITHGVA